MTIYYLMVKTHNITGLKYLCQTKRKDPHKYLGSGLHWERHLNKHGKDITTEIIRECQSKDELKEWGIHYSEEWNVVESDEWANLKPESGNGGTTPEIIAKVVAARRSNNTYLTKPESTKKRLATMAANGTLKPTPENIAKRIATRRKNGNLNTWTDESKAKLKESRRKNGTLNTNTAESIAKCKATKAAKLIASSDQ